MADTFHQVGDGSVEHYPGHSRTVDRRYGDEIIDAQVRELLSDLCEVLKEHGEVGFCEIRVTVDQGVATLHGAVGSLKLKRLAENIAGAIEGIKQVSNRLRVGKCRCALPRAQSHSGLVMVPPSASYMIT